MSRWNLAPDERAIRNAKIRRAIAEGHHPAEVAAWWGISREYVREIAPAGMPQMARTRKPRPAIALKPDLPPPPIVDPRVMLPDAVRRDIERLRRLGWSVPGIARQLRRDVHEVQTALGIEGQIVDRRARASS